MCNLSQGIKEEGIAKGRAEGLVEGRAEGLVEGRAEGFVEGRAEEKVNSAKKHINNLMKTKNMTFDEAVDILGIEKEIVEIIKKEME